MTFFQARAIANEAWRVHRQARHVRREAWPVDKWVIPWPWVWWYQDGLARRVVRATDYTKEDLMAGDWTNMPAELAECVIDPETGSTGGTPATPPSGGFPSPPGGTVPSGGWDWGGGGSGYGGVPSEGDPPPTGTIMVRFEGMVATLIDLGEGTGGIQRLVGTPNRTYYVPKVGDNEWTGTIPFGTIVDDGGGSGVAMGITVTRYGSGASATFNIAASPTMWIGGFSMLGNPAVLRGVSAANVIVGTPPGSISGGTAKVF